MPKTLGGGGKTLSYLLAGVVALAALQSIAADWTDKDGNTYTALKSIKGNGSAYIKTEIIPAGTETVKLKFSPTVIKSGVTGANEALFCSRDANTKAQFSGFKLANKIRIDRDSVQGTCDKTLTAANQDYVIVADFAGGTASIDGTLTPLSPALGTGDYTDTPTAKLYLYASHNGGGSLYNKGYYWLYYFQMYSSAGVLQHNFMPARSNNVIGLYDTVERKFYAPTGGSFAKSTVRTVTAPSGCKKWTGLGADNKMSTPENWEDGVAPKAGEDLDFTLAAPLAKINADMGDVTFGKVWIDDGDLPGFTGKLTTTSINDLERMTAYDTATADFSFMLTAPSGQNLFWNGGAAANWNATDKSWLCNSAASVWYDHNNAIFNIAGATATLTKDATAISLVFNQNATVDGSATLTVPTVSVAQNVTATIAAPTSGALAKTGAGTLTLKSSRFEATTLSEGTLVFSGNDTKLDWSKLTLGNDPAKPVTLRFEDGAALASESEEYRFGNREGITSTICKSGGDWIRGETYIGYAADANTTFVNESGDLTFKSYLYVGAQTAANATGSSELAIAGGKVAVSGSTGSQWVSVGTYDPGIVTVTNNAAFDVTLDIAFSQRTGSGTLNVSDGGTARIGGDIIFGSKRTDAGTGTVNIGQDGTVIADSIRCHDYGSGIVKFDGGTLKAGGEGKTLIQPSERMTVNVGANGGIIDNNSHNITNSCTIGGVGGMTFSGSGTTIISANQEYTGTTTVSEGTTLSVFGGISFAGDVKFAAGSKFDIANYVGGVNPVTAKSFTFPESGTVSLTLNGGSFIAGAYAICKASLVSAEQARLSFAPSTGNLEYSWDVSATGDLLLLVGDIHGYSWTGLAGDNKFANGGNWVNGSVPGANGPVDFSAVSSNISIDMEDVTEGTTFGAVTMGTGVITFTGEFAAKSFSDTSKIAVGENSTVTLDGDLEFGVDGNAYICYSVAQGGKFEVTGDIILTPEQTKSLLPCVLTVNEGVISAKGLVIRNPKDLFALSWFQDNASAKWLIGENGICGTGTGAFFVGDKPGVQATIIAATHFVVSAHIISWRNLTFDTAGYTVTLGTNTLAKSGGISGNGNRNTEASGSVTVRGAGKVVANYNVNDLTLSSISQNNPFTVTDGATLVFKPGANIGTGLLTIESGAALEIPQSHTVTHYGNLSLEKGAALAFNFTDRKRAPVLALADKKAVTFTGEGKIAVKITGDVWPIGGDYVLTACGGFDAEGVSLADGAPKWAKGIGVNEEGNIVLTVRPKSTMIIVR